MTLFTTVGCIEPYNPPAIKEAVDVLVVDGFINSSDNSVTVRLSKAVPINNNESPPPEGNAWIELEEENGNTYSLSETGNGVYKLTNQIFNPAKKYRLSIRTSNEKKYLSDFIELKSSPAIDSVSWKPSIQSEGINIFVNTHDETNNAKYYLWDFDETWEYTAKYPPAFRIKNGAVLSLETSIHRCWITKPSTEIHVASSSQLISDVIREQELVFIPIRSQKVSYRYSILVRQRTLTKEAYEYYVQLKKSTESLGGLFDPLPSQVLGNVYSADDSNEPVLGYFGGGEVTEKRTFVRFSDLPLELRGFATLSCPVDSIETSQIRFYNDIILINSYGSPGIIGYTTSSGKNCMDCRDDGGDLTRPDFWD